MCDLEVGPPRRRLRLLQQGQTHSQGSDAAGFRRFCLVPTQRARKTKLTRTESERLTKRPENWQKMTQNQQKMDQNRYKTTTKRTNGYRPDWITRTRPEPAPETKSTIIQKTKYKPDPGVGAHLYSLVCVRVCLSSHCKL